MFCFVKRLIHLNQNNKNNKQTYSGRQCNLNINIFQRNVTLSCY